MVQGEQDTPMSSGPADERLLRLTEQSVKRRRVDSTDVVHAAGSGCECLCCFHSWCVCVYVCLGGWADVQFNNVSHSPERHRERKILTRSFMHGKKKQDQGTNPQLSVAGLKRFWQLKIGGDF